MKTLKQTLEKIANPIRAGLCAALLSLASGCAFYFPSEKFEKYRDGDEIYSEVGLRAGAEIGIGTMQLSEEKRSVYVHADDGGPSRGKVVLDIDKDFTPMQVKLGLEGSVGVKAVRVKAGFDLKQNSGTYTEPVTEAEYPKDAASSDRYADIKLQPLPGGYVHDFGPFGHWEGYESYGYAQLSQDGFASIDPFVGIDFNLGHENNFMLGFEYGFPYTEYNFEKGHWRWNSFETIERDSYKGRGQRMTAKIGYRPVCLYVSQEDYKVKLGDEKADCKNIFGGFMMQLEF